MAPLIFLIGFGYGGGDSGCCCCLCLIEEGVLDDGLLAFPDGIGDFGHALTVGHELPACVGCNPMVKDAQPCAEVHDLLVAAVQGLAQKGILSLQLCQFLCHMACQFMLFHTLNHTGKEHISTYITRN